jgi:rod shape-determining protein MreC
MRAGIRHELRSAPPGRRPSRTVIVLLLLACFTIITLDARGGDSSPVDPVRSAAADVFGPVENGTAAAVRPFAAVPDHFRTTSALRQQVADLEARNSQLRSRLAGSALDRNRAAELDGLVSSSRSTGYALVPARVVAMGPAQSFSRTVTIDAGRSSGIRPDLTVLNNDGLVGRVLRADRYTATVLLLIDQESVVGGRLGKSMEVGFLRGRGQVGRDARLDLELVDPSAVADQDDTLVTWGSRNGAPYVAGVPIGRVASVYSTPRQQSTHAVITPFVHFSTLDLVGVVVDRHIKSDRTVIKASSAAGRQ